MSIDKKCMPNQNNLFSYTKKPGKGGHIVYDSQLFILFSQYYNSLSYPYWLRVQGGVKGQKHEWGLFYRVFSTLSYGFGKMKKFQVLFEKNGRTRQEKRAFRTLNLAFLRVFLPQKSKISMFRMSHEISYRCLLIVFFTKNGEGLKEHISNSHKQKNMVVYLVYATPLLT